MTNNDLLHLYNLEKKTFDDYGRWQSVLFSCWLVIISAPRILDLSLSRSTLLLLLIASILLCSVVLFLNIQKGQTNRRMAQIMTMLIAKNP